MSIHDMTADHPHITIPVGDDIHIVPVPLVRDWIAGRCDPDPEVTRAIIAEWLRGLEG